MEICKDRHEPVCYENYDYRIRKKCPACEALDQLARCEEELEEVRAEKDEAVKHAEELQQLIDAEERE